MRRTTKFVHPFSYSTAEFVSSTEVFEFSIDSIIPSRTPIHFLQESYRSGTYQTLSAKILQES